MSYLHCPTCQHAYNVAASATCPFCPVPASLVDPVEDLVGFAEQLARAVARATPAERGAAAARMQHLALAAPDGQGAAGAAPYAPDAMRAIRAVLAPTPTPPPPAPQLPPLRLVLGQLARAALPAARAALPAARAALPKLRLVASALRARVRALAA